MPTISVIVPVYKVEPYLRRCVDSILAQTYTDFELILVDDGSPDNCGAICDEYAEKDSRVRVIHQENRGVSAARNLGVREALGKYIAFVDSDDAIHPQMYELLVPVLDNTDYPFVHCAFHRSHDEDVCVFPEHYAFSMDDVREMTSDEGMVRMMDWKTYGHYVVKGIYRSDHICRFYFPEGTRWEDITWSGEVVGNAGKYAYVPYDLYSYRMSDVSLVHTYDWSVQKQYFGPVTEYVDQTRKYTPSVATKVELLTYESLIERYSGLMKKLHPFTGEQKDYVAQISKKCRITVGIILKSDMQFRRKLVYLISLISFPFACELKLKLIR